MDLKELRQKIDRIDSEILRLLNERCRMVQMVGECKKKQSSAVYVPEREQQVFDRLSAANPGPLKDATLRAVYCEIMSGALALEHDFTVAYADERLFSTALAKFGRSVQYKLCPDIQGVCLVLQNGTAVCGVISAEAALPDSVKQIRIVGPYTPENGMIPCRILIRDTTI